jgi:xanthine dehydrogenase accessory factor
MEPGTPACGTPFVEATVVRAQSPTSVRAGDSAKVAPDGTIDGFVGGACAEASVRLYALRSLQSGEPVLLRILPSGPESEPSVEDGAVTVQNPCLSGGALEIFLKPRLPAAMLRVVGTTPIATALADLGRRLGYAVEQDPAEGTQTRADDAAVLVASHGHDEERILTAALRDGVPYVGLVASRKRGDAIKLSLDLTDEQRDRLHTPAGVDIGAVTPEEIALSILAEVISLRASDAAARRRLLPGEPELEPAAVAQSLPVNDESEPRPEVVPLAPVEVAMDPVCGMEVALSPASIQLERDGDRFYFCSEGCRDSFAAEGAHGATIG